MITQDQIKKLQELSDMHIKLETERLDLEKRFEIYKMEAAKTFKEIIGKDTFNLSEAMLKAIEQ